MAVKWVKCPKCGYDTNILADSKKCTHCGAKIGSTGASSLFKGIGAKAPAPIAAFLAVIALVITFFITMDSMIRFYLVAGFTGISLILWGFRLPTIALIILTVYLFLTTVPLGQGLMASIGLGEIITSLTKFTCTLPCYIGYAFSGGLTSGANINDYCNMQCNVVEIIQEGCTDCLSISQQAGTDPAIHEYQEIVTISLTMAESGHDAENVVVRTASEQVGGVSCYKGYDYECPEGVSVLCFQDLCTEGEGCLIRAGRSLELTATFCSVNCVNGHFKYNITANYDYYTTTENSFSIIPSADESQTTSRSESKSTSSSGPLLLSIGAIPEFIAGQRRPAITVFVKNAGANKITLKEIRIYQTHPQDLELTLYQGRCSSGAILRNGVQENDYIVFRDSSEIRPGATDQVTCTFETLSVPITVPRLTYTFIGIANYTAGKTLKADLFCSITL